MMRARVYDLLRQGYGMPYVAQELKISRQAVQRHAQALIKDGALTITNPGASPLHFQSGPKAHEFEAWAQRQSTNQRGRSAVRASPAGIRLHGDPYLWRFAEGPLIEPEWSHKWAPRTKAGTPGGVRFRRLFRDVPDVGRCRIVEQRGRDLTSLRLDMPEERVWSPEDVQGAEKSRLRRAASILRAFAKHHGYRLVGSLERLQPVEYGLEVEGLDAPFGVPGRSVVWADGSPPGGRLEVETRDREIAGAWAGLPVWQDQVKRDLQESWDELRAHREVLQEVAALQREAALTQRMIVDAMVPPTRPLAKPEPAPPGPEVA